MPVRNLSVREKEIVANFVKKRKPTFKAVERMSWEINSFLRHEPNIEKRLKAYGADPIEMLRRRTIDVRLSKNRDPKYGCYQASSVLFYVLREIGLKPRLTRYLVDGKYPHTTVIVKIGESIYEIDTLKEISRKLGQKELDEFKALRKKRQFKFITPQSISYDEFKQQIKTKTLF